VNTKKDGKLWDLGEFDGENPLFELSTKGIRSCIAILGQDTEEMKLAEDPRAQMFGEQLGGGKGVLLGKNREDLDHNWLRTSPYWREKTAKKWG